MYIHYWITDNKTLSSCTRNSAEPVLWSHDGSGYRQLYISPLHSPLESVAHRLLSCFWFIALAKLNNLI